MYYVFGIFVPGIFSRRGFIARVVGLLAGTSLAACGRGQPSHIDSGTLAAVLDTLIPADEDPGALDAGVLEAIRLRIETDPVSTRRYQRLLEWVAGRSRAMHQRPFGQLSLPEREHLLNELYHSSNRELVQHRIDLHVVVRHCFHAFYSSPAAAGVIGYHPPIEGGYPDYGAPPSTT